MEEQAQASRPRPASLKERIHVFVRLDSPSLERKGLASCRVESCPSAWRMSRCHKNADITLSNTAYAYSLYYYTVLYSAQNNFLCPVRPRITVFCIVMVCSNCIPLGQLSTRQLASPLLSREGYRVVSSLAPNIVAWVELASIPSL